MPEREHVNPSPPPPYTSTRNPNSQVSSYKHIHAILDLTSILRYCQTQLHIVLHPPPQSSPLSFPFYDNKTFHSLLGESRGRRIVLKPLFNTYLQYPFDTKPLLYIYQTSNIGKMSVVGVDFGVLNTVIAVARNRGVDVVCARMEFQSQLRTLMVFRSPMKFPIERLRWYS